jgi:hypothetical protein
MQGPKPSFRVPARSRNSTQEKLYDQMQNPGGPTGGLARGGAIRDNIMNTYAMMAEGGSTTRRKNPSNEDQNQYPLPLSAYPTTREEISEARKALDEDNSMGMQYRKYLNPFYYSDILSNMMGSKD